MSDIALVEGNNELNVQLTPILPPVVGWISPISHTDPDNVWAYDDARWPAEYAYDGNPETWAYTIIWGKGYGGWLIMPVAEAYIDRIKFLAMGQPGGMNEADVDVYYGG
ncbi:unnamed protein product, partial [marine sediment metagenome]